MRPRLRESIKHRCPDNSAKWGRPKVVEVHSSTTPTNDRNKSKGVLGFDVFQNQNIKNATTPEWAKPVSLKAARRQPQNVKASLEISPRAAGNGDSLKKRGEPNQRFYEWRKK